MSENPNKTNNINKVNKLNYEILQKMSDLATAGFGLVAALAWNEAIKSLFEKIFPKTGGIIAKFIYAAIITAVVVFITIRLGKLVNLAKKRLVGDENNDLDKVK